MFNFLQVADNSKLKGGVAGTIGFRAPEVTMKQDYDGLVDIFSAGVTLFITLTAQSPFSRVLEAHIEKLQQQGYQKSDRYSLLTTDINEYWRRYIGYKTIVHSDAKHLILKMLEFDPRRRICTKDIFNHKWYTGKSITNQMELKAYVELLLNIRSNTHDIPTNYDYTSKSVPLSYVKLAPSDRVSDKMDDQKLDQFSTLKMTPLSIDETNPSLIVTTSGIKLVFDTLKDGVEKELKGVVEFENHNQVLLCSINISNMNENNTTSNGGSVDAVNVQFSVTMYVSRMWNSNDVLPDSKLTTNQAAHLVIINEINGLQSTLTTVEKQIITMLEGINCTPVAKLLSSKSITGNTTTNPIIMTIHPVVVCVYIITYF